MIFPLHHQESPVRLRPVHLEEALKLVTKPLCQRLWRGVTPEEKAFQNNPSPTKEERNKLFWHQEAEWTLLWVIGKVESLGLPTRECDTRRLVDEIIPPLGSDIADFVATAKS